MHTNEAFAALGKLPAEWMILKMVDCQLKFFDDKLIIIHCEKKPMVFDNDAWRVLEPREWCGPKTERAGGVPQLA